MKDGNWGWLLLSTEGMKSTFAPLDLRDISPYHDWLVSCKLNTVSSTWLRSNSFLFIFFVWLFSLLDFVWLESGHSRKEGLSSQFKNRCSGQTNFFLWELGDLSAIFLQYSLPWCGLSFIQIPHLMKWMKHSYRVKNLCRRLIERWYRSEYGTTFSSALPD